MVQATLYLTFGKIAGFNFRNLLILLNEQNKIIHFYPKLLHYVWRNRKETSPSIPWWRPVARHRIEAVHETVWAYSGALGLLHIVALITLHEPKSIPGHSVRDHWPEMHCAMSMDRRLEVNAQKTFSIQCLQLT